MLSRNPAVISTVVVVTLGLALIPLGPIQGQPALTPELDRARKAPIADGRAAAGIGLGDHHDAVTKALGRPFKIEAFEAGARRDFLYAAFGPGMVWGLVIAVSISQDNVQAIKIVSARRPPEALLFRGPLPSGTGSGIPRPAFVRFMEFPTPSSPSRPFAGSTGGIRRLAWCSRRKRESSRAKPNCRSSCSAPARL